jgi:hypothetical protein
MNMHSRWHVDVFYSREKEHAVAVQHPCQRISRAPWVERTLYTVRDSTEAQHENDAKANDDPLEFGGELSLAKLEVLIMNVQAK